MKFQGGSASPRHPRSARVMWLLSLLFFASISFGEEAVLMTPLEIQSLPREEAALAKPVKVRGVVTFAYPDEVGDFVIEDASGGLYINADDSSWSGKPPPVSSLVEVSGVTDEGGFAPLVKLHSFEILGTSPLPVARPVTANQL